MSILRTKGKHTWARLAFGALPVLLALGCDPDAHVARHREWARSMAGDEATKLATELLAALVERRFDDLESLVAPELWPLAVPERLTQILGDLPESRQHEIELISARTLVNAAGRIVDLRFQLRASGRWASASVRVQPVDGKLRISAFGLDPQPRSLVDQHALTLEPAGVPHAVIFPWAVLAPGACLLSAVLCLRTPIPKRKWLWLLYVLIGFGAITLNWTTGELSFQLIRVQLLGVSAGQVNPYEPWIVAVSFPGGALHFMLRRQHWIRAAQGLQRV